MPHEKDEGIIHEVLPTADGIILEFKKGSDNHFYNLVLED